MKNIVKLIKAIRVRYKIRAVKSKYKNLFCFLDNVPYDGYLKIKQLEKEEINKLILNT